MPGRCEVRVGCSSAATRAPVEGSACRSAHVLQQHVLDWCSPLMRLELPTHDRCPHFSVILCWAGKVASLTLRIVEPSGIPPPRQAACMRAAMRGRMHACVTTQEFRFPMILTVQGCLSRNVYRDSTVHVPVHHVQFRENQWGTVKCIRCRVRERALHLPLLPRGRSEHLAACGAACVNASARAQTGAKRRPHRARRVYNLW